MRRQNYLIMTKTSVLLLAQDAKWQTRRVIEPQPIDCGNGWWQYINKKGEATWHGETWQCQSGTVPIEEFCPYGPVGTVLWVREAMHRKDDGIWYYSADDEPVGDDWDDVSKMAFWMNHKKTDHCSPIHMPKWASRFYLKVTKIRAQRVQDISEEDAIAEGVCQSETFIGGYTYEGCNRGFTSAKGAYLHWWDVINMKHGYPSSDNPWTWAITFKQVQP